MDRNNKIKNVCACRFCNIWHGIISKEIDNPIMKRGNYLVLASIGAFIHGWSLIVSKDHTYSMKNAYDDTFFLEFANDWISKMKIEFNSSIIIFEHGANHEGSNTSCGTNHAHLHVVPYEGSLLNEMKKEKTWNCVKYDEIAKLVGDSEYLLYSEIDENLESSIYYIHILQQEESQYFRRLLSKGAGVLEYSYKDDPRNKESLDSYKVLKHINY